MKYSVGLVFGMMLVVGCLLFAGEVYGRELPKNAKLVGSVRTETGEGKKYQVGWMNVVVLNGGYEEMGEQYGTLMKTEIGGAYEAMVEGILINIGGATYEELKELLYDTGWNAISERQKSIVRGLAVGAGLTEEQAFILDQVNYGIMMVETGHIPVRDMGCSFAAANGPFVKEPGITLGRNFDWFSPFMKFGSLLTLVVYNPTDGSRSVASVTYAGWVNVLTGFNDRELFMELNSGMEAYGQVIYKDRSRIMNEMLEMLFDSGDINTLRRRIRMVKPDFPNIINVASKDDMISFENAPDRVFERINNVGDMFVLVSTNSYLNDEWGIEVFDGLGTSYSMTRYIQLNKLLDGVMETVPTGLNATVMQWVMEQPLMYENGTMANGATEYYPISKMVQAQTVYTVVAVPGDGKMWIRVPNVKPWVEVDYAAFFTEKD